MGTFHVQLLFEASLESASVHCAASSNLLTILAQLYWSVAHLKRNQETIRVLFKKKKHTIQKETRVYYICEKKKKNCRGTNKCGIVLFFKKMSQKWLTTAMFLPSPDERSLVNTTASPNTALNSSVYINKLNVVISSQSLEN